MMLWRRSATTMKVSYNLCVLLIFTVTACSHFEYALCAARCGHSLPVLDSKAGEIRSSSYYSWSYRFGSTYDCWIIKGVEGEPIVLSFSQFSARCRKEWVSLKSSAGGEPVVLCGSNVPEPIEFPGGNITVMHHFLPQLFPVSSFLLSYSRDSSPCPETSIECLTGRCLPLSWRCNGRVECLNEGSGIGTDEKDCETEEETSEPPTYKINQAKEFEEETHTERYDRAVAVTPASIEWPCGGLLQTFYGTFLPPASRGRRLHCVWTLDPQDTRTLRLDLQQLVLGSRDKITVYNGEQGKGDLLKTITSASNYKSVQVESHTGLLSLAYDTFGSEGSSFNATFHVGSYCPPWEGRCGGAAGGCFTQEQRCDGKWDCPETGKDEEGCKGCGRNQFACDWTGPRASASSHFPRRPVCYPATERCNYRLYCADNSDEKDCTVCQPGTFHCDSDRCVFEIWRCDGQVDCKDGTDELNCTITQPPKVITAARATSPGDELGQHSALCETTGCGEVSTRGPTPARHRTRTTDGHKERDGTRLERGRKRSYPHGCTDEKDCETEEETSEPPTYENNPTKESEEETHTERYDRAVAVTPASIEWPCGGLLQTFYGTFLPPASRGRRLHCVWTLDPQDTRTLRLDLQQLVLGSRDKITVYNGEQGKGDLLKTITSASNYKSVQVESHTGLLSLAYDTFGSEGSSFNATFHVGSYCPPWEGRCGGAAGGCFTQEQRCDGKWDCPETGKDEEGCKGCGRNQFACDWTGPRASASSHFPRRPVCYPATERCNYRLYCADNSDEKDCTVCQPGTFHCDSDRCVFEIWRCDGQVDCKDGTDELNCTITQPPKVITAARATSPGDELGQHSALCETTGCGEVSTRGPTPARHRTRTTDGHKERDGTDVPRLKSERRKKR